MTATKDDDSIVGDEWSATFMPNLCFLLFELIIYLQLALCLHHARKHGTTNLLRLFAGIIFGVPLEPAFRLEPGGVLMYSLSDLKTRGIPYENQ